MGQALGRGWQSSHGTIGFVGHLSSFRKRGHGLSGDSWTEKMMDCRMRSCRLGAHRAGGTLVGNSGSHGTESGSPPQS